MPEGDPDPFKDYGTTRDSLEQARMEGRISDYHRCPEDEDLRYECEWEYYEEDIASLMYYCAKNPCSYDYVCPDALFEYCMMGVSGEENEKLHEICEHGEVQEDAFNCAN